jgi:MYXO-CTERM domain-containing protein
MNRHVPLPKISTVLIVLLANAGLCSASVIVDSGISALTSSDSIQTGRLFRTGIPSDWSAPKPFPGTTGAPSSFFYETFVITNITRPYIQITIYDVNNTGATFAAAYLNSYQPNSLAPNYGLDINYLGDAGSSGNVALVDSRAFQVIAPVASNLVVVVSSTGFGLQQPFQFLVEGFYDTSFSDAPEPATIALEGGGVGLLMLLALLSRRRQRSLWMQSRLHSRQRHHDPVS